MSRILAIPVSDALFSKLQRRARDIGNGTKAEDVAEDWLEQRGREVPDQELRFREAGEIVDRRMRAQSLAGDFDKARE